MRIARLWLATLCRGMALLRLGQAERWEARAIRLEARLVEHSDDSDKQRGVGA